jgi:hypothetical protein
MIRFALALCLSTLALEANARGWYEARGVLPPKGNRIYICHGYGCRIVTPVQLSDAEIRSIAKPLAGRNRDAEAERKAVSRVVQAFETVIGKRAGTSSDLPGMQFGAGKSDQMDCIDEATNTTSLLRLLAEQGHLRHHTVGEPKARGFFLDGRYPHATATIRESAGGEQWAVDSWPAANAEPPIIQPLSEWYSARGGQPQS